jgi:hypothetical protein
MKLKLQVLVVPVTAVGAALAVSYALRNSVPGEWFTNGIATGAFLATAIAAYKEQIFAFEPLVTGGDVWWVRGAVAGNRPHLAVELQFRNAGYEGGVIEQVRLFVRQPQWTAPRVYEPVAVLDPVALTKSMGVVDKESLKHPFSSIVLGAKGAAAHTILFAPSHDAQQPDPAFSPGLCEVEVYLDVAGADSPTRTLSFSHTLVSDNFVSYDGGISQYLPKSRFNAAQLAAAAKPAQPERNQ